MKFKTALRCRSRMGRKWKWLVPFLDSHRALSKRQALCCAFMHVFNNWEQSLWCLLASSSESGTQEHSRGPGASASKRHSGQISQCLGSCFPGLLVTATAGIPTSVLLCTSSGWWRPCGYTDHDPQPSCEPSPLSFEAVTSGPTVPLRYWH